MGKEALKTMRDQLVSCSQGQLGDIAKVDAKQLGQAIDMIKDLSKAIYYDTITESMEKAEKQEQPINNINYYTRMYPEYRDIERNNGYMYYGGGSNQGNSGTTTAYYSDMMRDPRQGRSPMRRRMYMQGKQQHKDTNSQLYELEAYLQELSTDIAEMIKDASQEEKAILRQKMSVLADKIK